MEPKYRMGKLNIIEPWELATEKAVDALIIDRHEGEYLFSLTTPLSIKGKHISYLIGQLRDQESLDIISNKTHGTIALNMVYSEEINAQNFRDYSIKNFRGNFLLGEIIV
jgi:hypothetical protein